ncbi:MAG TPA: hypothetical protein VFG50_16715 [Rhodothermales bacterium]|nr:hypothetical protein [Rhodothermales bacterium]
MPSTTRTRISARAVLTVLGTLAVGIALGVLGTNMVYQHRIAEFYRMRTPAGFIERVEDIVQPRNEVQRAQIRPACKHAADRMSAISSYSHQLRSNVVDSMQASLQPILATDQQNRLHEWASRFHSHGKHHKQSHDE